MGIADRDPAARCSPEHAAVTGVTDGIVDSARRLLATMSCEGENPFLSSTSVASQDVGMANLLKAWFFAGVFTGSYMQSQQQGTGQ
ncbi:hypothetical protein CBR_g12796 [Chara braunii]|uniref:Uncharacterized protein n=1 Tax=Chara braunii TaxID=69332 RepID=A0A388KSP5_CHABU|nr:hypothetical protein CBR_g12796 [Chara braunii]|eukprot:GBG73080.1 hypothetical protein CBR_g12796 [Chara braunii]